MLLLLLGLRARAETASGFDQALAAQVFTAAFTFMAPRTLDKVTIPQISIWGLRGITSLDPNLIPVLHDADVTLTGPKGAVAVLALPDVADVPGWGTLVAGISAAAWRNSDALKRAGTQGIISNFFDEVFNHLDPYSRYVAPDAAQADRAYRRGAAGIGVTLAGSPGAIIIATTVKGGPAELAGVPPGARLVAIDGHRLRRETADTALAALNGDEGSPVGITLRVRGAVQTLSLTRALVPADTVSASRDGDIEILRIAGFTASTAARLHDELQAAVAHTPPPAGLVFDLRGNRGGLLTQAVQVANLVMTSGLIATTQGRDPDADHRWDAEGADLAQGLPIAVLVDGRSASAAELLAASLSDDGRAVVIGSTTLGKGLVQTVTTLPDGGELFVTWSRVLAPRGWPLQGLGVMPQLCTSLGADATQRQLDALAAGQQTMRAILATHRAARTNLPLAEMLTIRNACPAALGTDTDLAAAHALLSNPIAYASALAPAG